MEGFQENCTKRCFLLEEFSEVSRASDYLPIKKGGGGQSGRAGHVLPFLIVR